ncbi:M48 family metallopeptidase [Pseudomonas mangrovi]|uniref:Heat-shock protein HtpX n=1 Tax=Pseudomonas mangrovi TaxID=2161748 RepID=A0A2T5P7N3_9PSED|nr:M48 family metallopeptidase [Pseudomonas mangrovi]PTU73741.1 heat-shock protein HtpX [Pseudomonas mangrovi]
MENFYPAGPAQVPAALTRPSSAYKRQAWLAMASLALFVALYFALSIWFGWTAWRMLGALAAGGKPDPLGIITGAASAFLCIFMVKALFFVNRGGATDQHEIRESDQPQLFAFLNQLADEAGAPRPHRVFLSARVNAAVFYDLSLLNLLFPSRKNLEIGLSLVNVLTLSELKAVLAHEFGHFAQRSMAIGSWVYIAQQIAAQVVSKRDALDKLLAFISRIDLRVAWIGWGLSLIVWSIRSLLDTVFRLVVLAQRALSRQMEFQADLVAVSLTGSDELVHALHKLQSADDAWDRALGFANDQYHQGRSVDDLFAVQTRIIERLTQILNDPTYGSVPASASATPEQRRIFSSGFAQPPQMWSTHPANCDREENAKRVYLAAPHDARSAWCLFQNPQALRQELSRELFGSAQLQSVPMEQSLQTLDASYARRRYASEYQGAYLGRALARHASSADELYPPRPAVSDLHQALAQLYPASLAHDLLQLRTLEDERGQLEALRDKVYRATGGNLVFRGQTVARRDLGGLIEQVAAETAAVRERIHAHDRQCRGAHLAAAAALGQNWDRYLIGLLQVLHYAEHSLADLQDAQGLLGNVVAVVTADGKVSSRELKRLIVTTNEIYRVLKTIHHDKHQLLLDSALCERLEIESWATALEDFTLPPANENNINDWMNVIDGWSNSLAAHLANLSAATIEQLLSCETELAAHVRAQTTPQTAPQPSSVPPQYPVLLPGKERKRQKKLGWWDRFQIADGAPATLARLLVALTIVALVLGAGSLAKVGTPITVYNGLGTLVTVAIDERQYTLMPFTSITLNVELKEQPSVSAHNRDGELIEQFQPTLGSLGAHQVYNVAGASPLVRWTASYGSAREEEPSFMGAPRWSQVSVDHYFSDPPSTLKTKGSGGTRRVLSGAGDVAPDELLQMASDEQEARRIIELRARWDADSSAHRQTWQDYATRLQAAE